MARIKENPFRIYPKAGRAVLDYDTPEGERRKVALGLALSESPSPAERGCVMEAAWRRYRELTSERVLTNDARIKTSLRFQDLYALYLERWEEQPNETENARRKRKASFMNRKAYATAIRDWASNEAVRPDGSLRWKGDARTPLQRITDDDAPEQFLAWRLQHVKRKTMRKEKSNLAMFLAWCQASGYLATTPTVKLPVGSGIANADMAKSGWGVDVPLTLAECATIIKAMPERSTREPKFLVEPFFRFLWISGLRPVTVCRFEVGRNWSHGQDGVQLFDEDDKANYGRFLPLSKLALEILEQYAPVEGHIFGFHDRRDYVKDAALRALDASRAAKFGSYHLRHFFGTFMTGQPGASLPGVQYAMGHTQLETTSGYVHARELDTRTMLTATTEQFREAFDSAPILPRSPSKPPFFSRGERIRTSDPQTPSVNVKRKKPRKDEK